MKNFISAHALGTISFLRLDRRPLHQPPCRMNQANQSQGFRCPGCQSEFKLKRDLAGKAVKCPTCQTTFVVPNVPSSPPAETTDMPVASAGNAGASQKPCGYCQQSVPVEEYELHFNQHMVAMGMTGRMPGLEEDKQYKGDISSHPRFYVHDKCGQVTGMAEKIVRTYLVNPWQYGYGGFCIGCRTTVPDTELRWVETGEGMHNYVRRLQAEHPNAAALRSGIIKLIWGVAAFLSILLALIVGGITAIFATWTTTGIVFLVVSALATPVLAWLFYLKRGGI